MVNPEPPRGEPTLVLHIYGPPKSKALVQFGNLPEKTSGQRRRSDISYCPQMVASSACVSSDECYQDSDCGYGNFFCCYDGCNSKCHRRVDVCQFQRSSCHKWQDECLTSEDCGPEGYCCHDGCVNVCAFVGQRRLDDNDAASRLHSALYNFFYGR